MKLLTDENIHIQVAKELTDLGHDVLDIKLSHLEGIKDTKIIRLASNQQRIIITHDIDYLNNSRNLPDPPSAIIILPGNQPYQQIINRLNNLFKNQKLFKKNHPCVYILEYNQLEIYQL